MGFLVALAKPLFFAHHHTTRTGARGNACAHADVAFSICARECVCVPSFCRLLCCKGQKVRNMAEADAACPWQRHYDDTGTVFYYNESTEESEWDIPPGWEDHFANLDNNAGPEADGGASGADASAVEDGHVSAAAEPEQEDATQDDDDDNDDDGRREAEQQQVDDAEGAEALLGLAQAAGGEQHRSGEDGTSPPQQQQQQQEQDRDQEHDGAGSSPPPMDEDERQAGERGESAQGSRARESSEDIPADAAPTGHAEVSGDGGDDRTNEGRAAEDAAAAPTDAAAAGCPWIQSVDEESGNVFYYNEATEESSWDEPPEYTKFHAAAAAAAAAAVAAGPTAAAVDSDSEEEYYQQEQEGDEASAGADGYGDGRGTPSPTYSYDGQEDGDPARPSSSSRSPSPRRSDRPSSSTAAASARRTRKGSSSSSSNNNNNNANAKSSPDMGLSFPAFGDDYSPAHEDDEEDDWQVNEEEEEEPTEGTASGSPGDGAAGGSGTAFAGSESEGLRSGANGFGVGELSPTVDNGGGHRTGGEGRQGGGVEEAGDKENSVVVGSDGKPPRYSEEEKKQMVEKAEREVADCERRVRFLVGFDRLDDIACWHRLCGRVKTPIWWFFPALRKKSRQCYSSSLVPVLGRGRESGQQETTRLLRG